MLCGIYKLEFKGTNKVYIGQSTNINQRFNTHIYSMKHNTAPKKLQDAYNIYGAPNLVVLEECTKEILNDYENEIIEIYDSVNNGFNTLEVAGDIPNSIGENNPKAKYTNKKIEEVFLILVNNPKITFSEVEVMTGVHNRTIRKISSGENHSWLKSIYPIEYDILMALKGTRKSQSRARNVLIGSVVSPTGQVLKVYNAKEFAKENSLGHSCLCKLLKDKQMVHKGWKKYNEQEYADNTTCGKY